LQRWSLCIIQKPCSWEIASVMKHCSMFFFSLIMFEEISCHERIPKKRLANRRSYLEILYNMGMALRKPPLHCKGVCHAIMRCTVSWTACARNTSLASYSVCMSTSVSNLSTFRLFKPFLFYLRATAFAIIVSRFVDT